jgi:hypothetical protein
MRFDKKGQLTLFIIAAIVVVVVVVGYFVVTNRTSDSYFQGAGVSEGVDEIKDYMDACLEYVAEDSLVLVSAQGGYFDAPARSEDLGNDTFLPFYSYEGVNYVPSLKIVEDEMAKAMDDIVTQCVDYAEFTGYDVSYGSVKTNVEVRDNEVEFTVDMPLILKREGHSMIIELKESPVVLDTKLNGMYNVAKYYMEDIKDDNEYCVNCLGELALANGVYVDVLGIDPLTSSVIISEDSTGEFLYFVFLNKFSEGSFDQAPQLIGEGLNYGA